MKTLIRFTLAVMLSVAPLAFANFDLGSGAGNGTGTHDPYEFRAWFNQPGRTVSYCATISPTFGVSLEDARKVLEETFSTWVDYLQQKRLERLKLATHLEYRPSCDGNEDLHVHFGTSDAAVEKFQAGYEWPIGFSRKTTFDPRAGWGRGILWLSNPLSYGQLRLNWKTPDALRGALLHEWGHIFGNQHFSHTVMDEGLGYRILGRTEPDLPLTTIDSSSRELTTCTRCEYVYSDALPYPLAKRFQRLVGRAPVGEVSAELDYREAYVPGGTLVIRDSVGEARFQLKVNKSIAWVNRPLAFNVLGVGQPTDARIWAGWLIDEKGTKFPVTFCQGLNFLFEIVDLEGPPPIEGEWDDGSRFFLARSYRIVR